MTLLTDFPSTKEEVRRCHCWPEICVLPWVTGMPRQRCPDTPGCQSRSATAVGLLCVLCSMTSSTSRAWMTPPASGPASPSSSTGTKRREDDAAWRQHSLLQLCSAGAALPVP